MDYKLKDLTERLEKETKYNAHKMLYMWIKQDIVSLTEYHSLALNLAMHIVSKSFTEKQMNYAYDKGYSDCLKNKAC